MIKPQIFPVFRNDLSQVSAGGLAVAGKIAEAYRRCPAARIFLVGGSVSRGCADGYSDLEIGVFWDGDVPTEERREAVTRLGGELWTMDRDGRRMEHFGLYNVKIGDQNYSGSCMVSMNHNTIAAMEACLEAVLNRWETDPDYQELLFAVQYAVALHGENVVANWNARSAAFPIELAAKIVQENLSFGTWFVPESYAARNDYLLLQRHFLIITEHLIRILLGLNRLYLPSTDFKWLDATIARMTLTPIHLAERLRTVFQTPNLVAGWQELKALMFETLDLIDAHLPLVNSRSFIDAQPEINTAWARQRWDPLPPYTLMNRVGQSQDSGQR